MKTYKFIATILFGTILRGGYISSQWVAVTLRKPTAVTDSMFKS